MALLQEEESRLKAVLNDMPPSKELLEWAKEHINEDPDKTDLDLSELRDLIFERGECTPHRTDDDFLIRFLRARYFIVRKAHRLVVNYYDFKATAPEYFENINVRRLRDLAKTLILSIPPYKDQLGRRMLIFKVGNWDPAEYTIPEMFQLVCAILEMSSFEPETQIKGAVLIIDLSDLSLNVAWHMTPTLAKHVISLTMTSFPLRLEAVHVLHLSWIFDMAWNMFKPFLYENVKERIFFHGDDMESFHSHMDPKYLPKRYGGVHLDYPVDIWFEDVVLKNERISEEFIKLGFDQLKQYIDEEKLKEKEKCE